MTCSVKQIEGKGRGIVADRDFSKGETLLSDPILVLNFDEKEHIQNTKLQIYYFNYWFDASGNPDSTSTDIAFVFGLSSLINCSRTPNVHWRIIPKTQTLEIYALEDVEAGSELKMDYGFLPGEFEKLGWVD